jgi:hypothetical protein
LDTFRATFPRWISRVGRTRIWLLDAFGWQSILPEAQLAHAAVVETIFDRSAGFAIGFIGDFVERTRPVVRVIRLDGADPNEATVELRKRAAAEAITTVGRQRTTVVEAGIRLIGWARAAVDTRLLEFAILTLWVIVGRHGQRIAAMIPVTVVVARAVAKIEIAIG